jgi:hypothetical protein
MNDWYLIYVIETRRRQDDIKAAEAYNLVKDDPSSHPALKAHQRLFMALGAKMVQWGTRLQARYENLYPTPLRDYASEPPC